MTETASPPVGPFHVAGDITSWGRLVRRPQTIARPRHRDEIDGVLRARGERSLLASGLRRSYGDSCLNSDGALLDMGGLDRFISFDPVDGRLIGEAGLSLSKILQIVAPRGWFLPTTPGTRFVTLGGAVANDVHGKNHHRAGAFGNHVLSLGLSRADGERMVLSPTQNFDLFAATIGGLGLTGVIEWVEIQLARIDSTSLDVDIIPYGNLDEFWALADESVAGFEHTVAWIDCASGGAARGRGVFSRANWRQDGHFAVHGDETWKTIPVEVPEFALNRLTVRTFNAFYHAAHRAKAGRARQHYARFLYPLDAIRNWNRMYGRRGMLQYQCVIPPESQRDGIGALLDEIIRAGQGSFLAVLKTFGEVPSRGLLSFPRPGATLALDFPNRGSDTLGLTNRLDRIVTAAGGGLYPAKDGRVSAAVFRASFPKWREFLAWKDPGMNSDFWRRVGE